MEVVRSDTRLYCEMHLDEAQGRAIVLMAATRRHRMPYSTLSVHTSAINSRRRGALHLLLSVVITA